MAHELGHNLGMDHDFDGGVGDFKDKFSSTGAKCTGVRGIMDYPHNNGIQDRWSLCSNEDFRKNFIAWGGRNGYCLKQKQKGGDGKRTL